jgi:long-chain fatty acid transport protein
LKALAALAALIMVASLAGTARADGGYYTGPLGPRAAGRGGAFVARADDVTATSINPAGLTEIDGTTFQIGNQLAYYGYDYTRAPTVDYGQASTPTVTFGKVSNGTPWQAALPYLGAATRLGLPDWAFAAAFYAPPGISREQFPQDGGQRFMMVDRQAIILKGDLSAAWRYQDLFGLGLTVEWIPVPRLDYSLVVYGNTAPGVASPVSSSLDILAQTSGADWLTFNAIVGGWFRPRPWLELGLAGQVLPANIVTKSELTLSAADPNDPMMLNPVTTKDRQGHTQKDVTITLPLPLMVRGGARYRHLRGERELYDVELDVEYETWSRVHTFTLDATGLTAHGGGSLYSQPIPLGTIDIAKQWNDVFSVKLGGDFNLVPDRFTLRAGGYYETAAAPAAYANVDFPGARVFGAALGGSLLLNRLEVALTYQLRYQPSFTVSEADGHVYQQAPGSPCAMGGPPYTDPYNCNPNYPGQPAPTVNAGTYASTSHLVSLALIYRYGK